MRKKAKLIKAPQVFGLTLPNLPRTGLTHSYMGNPKVNLGSNSLGKNASLFRLNK